jgi:hypothetical protein
LAAGRHVGQQPQQHHRGHALGRQQPDQHDQLEAGRGERAGPAEQGTDEGPGQGDQAGRAGRVKRRDQGLGDCDADRVGGGLAHGRPQGQLALDLGLAADQPAQLEADTLHVVGGLYGNPAALQALLERADTEPNGPGTIVFNGDVHWLDVDPDDFQAIDWAAMLEVVDLDLEWTYLDPALEHPTPQVCHGRQELEQVLRHWAEHGLRAELEEVASDGELVMVGVRTPGVDAYHGRGGG